MVSYFRLFGSLPLCPNCRGTTFPTLHILMGKMEEILTVKVSLEDLHDVPRRDEFIETEIA
jgi:hypothetical protein